MKNFLLTALLLSGILSVKAQTPRNISLVGLQNYSQLMSGCWHYVAADSTEYALIGAENGIIIAKITNANPQTIIQLPGVSSLWHEVKVVGDFAYAVSEGFDQTGTNNGVQIMDLRYLPDSVPYRFYQGDGVIQGQLSTGHSITADSNYVYVNGHNISSLNRGVLILDVTDRWNPVYTGAITLSYCHDSYVRGDRLYTSDIGDGQFSVYDISDRANPVLLARQQTPGNFNHNTWLNDAGNVLFTTDEHPGQPVGAFDISDLQNITLIDTFFNGNFTQNEVHNVRVINDFLINPSYGSQLTIADVARPGNIIETGSYTTGSSLCWDADPYLPSGKIIATDMNSGLFYVFNPTYQRACYLEGIITDSVTTLPVNNSLISISGISVSAFSKIDGRYATGYLDSGTYVVNYSATGYMQETRTVSLQNGILTLLDVKLKPVGSGIETLSNTSLTVYPNPASTHLMVQTGDVITAYRILDEDGRLITEKSHLNSELLEIGISALSAGNYSILLVSGNKLMSKTFSVAR